MSLVQLNQIMKDPDPREMGFFEHLGELRRALIISVAAIILGTIAGFIWHKPLLDLLRAQAGNVQFVIVSPAEGFTAVMRLSACFCGRRNLASARILTSTATPRT